MNISRIEKKPSPIPKTKRVAAYARVSSGKDAMLHSLAAQISYYKNLIMNNPDWEFAGVYVDEALTGTKGSRPQFLKMLEDCRAGKIDMILTKSLSRFARNTVTALEAIQMLRREGVNVCFEREGIYSMDKNSEFIFTILAGTAQEESLSASENQKWKIRKNFREGIPTATRMMGYEFVDGTFVVIPEEAEVVKRVFSEYLSGKGLTAICKGLIAEGVPTKNGGIWCESVIRKMLTNEKYTGDLLLQKSFVENHITKRKMVNRGQLPQYLVEDDHEAIISKSDFAMVQDEIKRRAKKYAHAPASKPCDLTGKIICEQCGGHYRRKKLRSGKIVWICSTFNRLGKAHCASQQIPDSILRSLIGDTAFSEIRIPCRNTVTIVTKDGKTVTQEWQNPSRAESWTPEMKEKARQRRLSNG